MQPKILLNFAIIFGGGWHKKIAGRWQHLPRRKYKEKASKTETPSSQRIFGLGGGGEGGREGGGGAVLYGHAALLLYSQIGPSNKQSVSIQHDFPNHILILNLQQR